MNGRATLLVEIGNSRLKWASLVGGRFGESKEIDAHLPGLRQRLTRHWDNLPRPEGVWVASVGDPAVGEMLAAWCRERWSLVPRFVSSESRALGVVNAYRQPESLGVDRWLAMIAVHHEIPGPALILDCGTAVTLDLLDAAGHHQGGLIVPGLRMMAQALFAGTQLPRQDLPRPAAGPARGTAAAIASGGAQAVAALSERLAVDLACSSGQEVELVLTGGDALEIQCLLHRSSRCLPDLVLRGLRLVVKVSVEC